MSKGCLLYAIVHIFTAFCQNREADAVQTRWVKSERSSISIVDGFGFFSSGLLIHVISGARFIIRLLPSKD